LNPRHREFWRAQTLGGSELHPQDELTYIEWFRQVGLITGEAATSTPELAINREFLVRR
jgi:hypothetical protein